MQRVAILTGGESAEREVALRSAESVRSWLEPFFDLAVFDFPKDRIRFIAEYHTFVAAVPVFHGPGGEDGVVQGFLQTLGIPFIFSGVEAHAIGMNKVVTKQLVEREGLRVPKGELVSSVEEISIPLPFVSKPADDGSSLGVHIHHEMPEALDRSPVLVESFVHGKEFTVAVVDDIGGPVALPVIEIRSKNTFFDFESKYNADLVEEICPAPIDENLTLALQEMALIAHETIGAKHLSRTDMIVDNDGIIWFLEINTIPGMTKESLVPKSMRASGREFGMMLKTWIEMVI